MIDWTHRLVKARKRHQCVLCYRSIDPGETYLRGAAFDGTAWSWCECLHCRAVRIIYDISDGEEYDKSMFDEWSDEPRDVAELRHAAGYKMKWRTKSGRLLPVPELAAAYRVGERRQ